MYATFVLFCMILCFHQEPKAKSLSMFSSYGICKDTLFENLESGLPSNPL